MNTELPNESLTAAVYANVRAALAEDLGATGDLSASLICAEQTATAHIITRTPGVFCGQLWVTETMHQVDKKIQIDWYANDGDAVEADQQLFTLTGSAASLLTAERTALNFVQMLSGTATRTAQYVALLQSYKAQLLDTRKTIPGLRVAQKYAVKCGGGNNHRIGLFDAYLLKENHIAAAGSITAAVQAARKNNPAKPIEVEVENLTELDEAIAANADIAMIDNFTLADTQRAVAKSAGQIKLEASGGINENTLTTIAATGVDYISSGELTKTILPMDLSMRFITS
jgi:nicotinate-nucleotide pyrophosphorylase (carboxylating)